MRASGLPSTKIQLPNFNLERINNMSNFKHKVQTKTDAMQLHRNDLALKLWSKKNPSITLVRASRVNGVTTWNVPEWDSIRKSFCEMKLNHVKRYGSN